MTETLSHRLERKVHERGLLQHPFYRAWTAGTLSVDQLRAYAAQYYHFEEAFPTFLSGVHSRCPSLEVRQVLLDNLWDEEHGPDNHPELWLRFCRALGLSDREVTRSQPRPETRALVEGYRAVTQTGSYLAGLAAIFAYEVQAPAIAEQKIAGLSAFYGIDDPRAVAFFSVHREADVAHASAARSVLDARAREPEQRDAAIEAACGARDALWRFLDGAYAAGA